MKRAGNGRHHRRRWIWTPASRETRNRSTAIRRITRVYASMLLILFALGPAYLIAYLFVFQDPALKFENHTFHEIAIAAATLEGLFVAYVTWRCYQSSGEPLLRWLTLGFLGFVLIYALHGAFTGMAHSNMWLFLLYGPASRLAMSILLFAGLLSYNRPPDAVGRRSAQTWLADVDRPVPGDRPGCCRCREFSHRGRPGGATIDGGGRAHLLHGQRHRPAVTADSLAADGDFRHFGDVLRAVVARVHSGAAVESHVVARPRDFCRGIFSAQLRHCSGFPYDALILDHLQPGRIDGPAGRGDGPHGKHVAGTAADQSNIETSRRHRLR